MLRPPEVDVTTRPATIATIATAATSSTRRNPRWVGCASSMIDRRSSIACSTAAARAV